MRAKYFLLIFTLSVFAVYVFVTLPKQSIDIAKINIQDDNAVQKKLEKKQSDIEKSNEQKKIKKPVTTSVDEKKFSVPDQILTIDRLLDEQDKTEKNRQIIHNHVNLVQIFNDFRELRSRKIKTVSLDQLTQWLQILIYDAYLNNELENNNLPSIKLGDQKNLKPDLIPDDQNLSRLIKPNYLSTLRVLAEKISSFDKNKVSESGLNSLTIKIIDLAKRRKKQSEVFYLGLMKKYLISQEYTMSQKVVFAQQFVDAGDVSLAKYTLEYFQDSLDLPENQKNKNDIYALIVNIKAMGTRK